MARPPRGREAERARIEALDPEALRRLRAQAAERIGDVDRALERKGVAREDRKTTLTATRAAYARELKRRAPKKTPTLSPRMRMAIAAFIAGPPGVRGIKIRAAEAAGYNIVGDPMIGHALFRRPAVRAELAKHEARLDFKARDVIDQAVRLATSDARDLVEWDEGSVRLRASDAIPDDAAAAVAEVSQGADGAVKIKLVDKVAPLVLLAKIHRIVGDEGRGPVTVNVTVEERLTALPDEERRRAIDRYVALARPSDPEDPWTVARNGDGA